MASFLKIASVLNQTRSTTSSTYTYTSDRNNIWHYDADAFDSVDAIYLEAVMRCDDGADTAFAVLSKVSDDSDVTGSEISTSSTSNVRVRSGDIKANLVDGTDYRLRYKRSGSTASVRFDKVTVIIVQNGTITKTETSIDLGDDNGLPATYDVISTSGGAYAFTYLHDSTKFDGTTSIYLEAVLKCSSGSNTAYAELYDLDAASSVSSSEVSHTGDTVATRVRSSALTLTNGNEYVARVKGSTSGEDCLCATLIIQQTGSPTKTVSYIPILNGETATGSDTYEDSGRLFQYNASDWSATSISYRYDAGLRVNNTASTGGYIDLYNDTDATQIVEFSTTDDSLPALTQRSGTLTIPTDDGNTFTARKKETGTYSMFSGRSYLIAFIDFSSVGGGTFTPRMIIY